MVYLSLIQNGSPPDARPIQDATKKDVAILDEALADAGKRHMAEVVLALAAQIVSEAPDLDSPADTLGEREMDALALVGIDGSQRMSNEDFYASKPVREGLRRRAAMISEAVPLAEAAERLRVTDGRLRQRISGGSLVAVPRPHGRGWLIPLFQLTENGELPHLARILSSRTRSISAEALASFFSLPAQDLEDASPRDWLMAGRDPAPVERLIAGL